MRCQERGPQQQKSPWGNHLESETSQREWGISSVRVLSCPAAEAWASGASLSKGLFPAVSGSSLSCGGE